jgi:hypothetical protein
MHFMNKNILLLIISCLFLSSAFADQSNNTKHLGPYAEFSVGANLSYTLPGLLSSRHRGILAQGWGFGGALGYEFTPRFGLETGLIENYNAYKNWNMDDATISHLHTFILTTRFTKSLDERVALIGKLGAMSPCHQGSCLLMPYVGVGANYTLSSNLDVNVQYQGALYLIIAGTGLASTGLTYHF